MRRHYALLEAVLEYDHCSMKYAYARILNKKPSMHNKELLLEQKVNRTVKTLAREKLRLGYITQERASLLWQISVRDTAIETNPRLNSRGRNIINGFRDWLETANVVGLAVPRSLPIQLRKQETIELRTTVDLVLAGPKLVRIGPYNKLESAILATDETEWTIFDTKLGRWKKTETKRWTCDILQQLLRGMFRNIVWPHQDSRCGACIYKKICSPRDISKTK